MNSLISTPESRAFTGGRERKQRPASLCNLTLIFSSARRQNMSLSDPSGLVYTRRQQRCAFACVVCAWTHGPRWGNSASNNRPNRVGFHRSLQPQTFICFPPPADIVMDGSRKSAPHFCTGPRIIVYSIASNLWRELDGRGPVLKTTSVSHRNPATRTEKSERISTQISCFCKTNITILSDLSKFLTLVLIFDIQPYVKPNFLWYLNKIDLSAWFKFANAHLHDSITSHIKEWEYTHIESFNLSQRNHPSIMAKWFEYNMVSSNLMKFILKMLQHQIGITDHFGNLVPLLLYISLGAKALFLHISVWFLCLWNLISPCYSTAGFGKALAFNCCISSGFR